MKCAIYSRVSTEEQHNENQIEQLKNLAKIQNNEIVEIYIDVVSGAAKERPKFKKMLLDARIGKFNLLYFWSLDRFSREGIQKTLFYIKQLKQFGVDIKSIQEVWLDTSLEGVGELLISVFSWVAAQERKRISERTKAGLVNAKNVGKRGKDKKKRNNLGYKLRWVKKGV